jgi:hypothetical protein
MTGLFGNNQLVPQELALKLGSMTPEQLRVLPHSLLYASRQYVPQEQQGAISPYEHRAFTREAVYDNPLMAFPAFAGVLAYQPYKAVMGARSKPSVAQVKEGLAGIKDGLMQRLEEISVKYKDPFGDSTK